ncbi:MAG: carbon storage regulator [Isosphaeraceae bacterium]
MAGGVASVKNAELAGILAPRVSPEAARIRRSRSGGAGRTGTTQTRQSGDRREDAMLILSRKALQQIKIGDDIRLTVVKVDRNQVRIGIEAPASIPILRRELVGKARAIGPDEVAAESADEPAVTCDPAGRGIEPR